jgi:NUMOD4 motif/Bacterial regulatory proteins, gntR family
MNEHRAQARRNPGRPVGLRPISPAATHNPDECWLSIAGYEGLYEASDLGRIRSLPRSGTMGRILRPQRKEYFTVNLWRDDMMRTFTVHTLVARAFLGPCPDGQQVCHGPAGRFENAVANLSYGSAAKNLGPDKRRDGTMQAGVRNGLAKLTDEIVRECRTRAAAGESRGALAREFSISKVAMSDAIDGTTWRHLPVLPLPDHPKPPPRDRFAHGRLAARLETMIKGGELAPGARLPSLRVLADRYDVRMGTAFRAVEILRADGLISAKGIPGPFVLPESERNPQPEG